MEDGPQSSPKFDECIDNDDSKYLCGLSTILVANIQELKDRISQIEFIFCSQLFPNFQSRSKSFQKRLLEARKATNDEWKKSEHSLLHQIEELQLENQCTKEEVRRLNLSLQETKTRLTNAVELMSKYKHENVQLLNEVKNLEMNGKTIVNLKEQLGQKSEELAKGKKLQEELLQQIAIKDHNLMEERSKRKGLLEEFNKLKDNYKHLKSQYTFLLCKFSDSKENKSPLNMKKEEKDLQIPYLNKRSPREHKGKEPGHITSMPIETKLENDNRENSCMNPTSSSMILPQKKIYPNTITEQSIGLKRSAPSWRETRTRQEPNGADPHDDFLDTPMEIARNLNMGPQEEVQDLPVFALDGMEFNNSDDETQEVVKHDIVPQKQNNISALGSTVANKEFKYVEPVRKKIERENLKGVECKQCKKFYDAVLPDDDNASNGHKSMRCEHHDGVSRHRYKYAPPLTPEGFWNIGFESDL